MIARAQAAPFAPPEATDMWRSPAAILRSTLVRFLLVGGVSYLVNQALLVALYDGVFASLPRGGATLPSAVDLPLLLASIIALEVSILIRFALNDRWTFRDRCGKPLAARFYQSNFTSFGSPLICLAAVNILTPYFGVGYLLSNSLGILLGLAWNWFWSDRLVWAAARTPSRTAARRKWESQETAVLPVGPLPRTSPPPVLAPYSTPLPGGLRLPPGPRSAG
jgi:putative flippase GtrA